MNTPQFPYHLIDLNTMYTIVVSLSEIATNSNNNGQVSALFALIGIDPHMVLSIDILLTLLKFFV